MKPASLPAPLWHLQIRVHHKGTDLVLNLLESLGFQTLGWYECEGSPPSGEEDEQGFPIALEFIVEGYSKQEPDQKHLKSELETLSTLLGIDVPCLLSCQPVDHQDWLQMCYQHLAPQTIGSYYVYGSHDQEGALPPGLIPLHIDAATAFGSGDHPTTAGCLTAITDLQTTHSFHNVVDMGCGSGILAIALAKTWPKASVLAVDNDPESVRVALHNTHLNHCLGIQCLLSEGFDHTILQTKAPFDLIVANILAKPLCEMAPHMRRTLSPEGLVILSGLLERQQTHVIQAYEEQGFHLTRLYNFEKWITLVLK